MYNLYFKRFFDILFSSITLLLASPFLFLITLFLTLTNSGKPYFFQLRPGKDERLFRLIKFKTMNDKTDTMGNLLPSAQRITKIGRFLRSISLDEIPQLWNVLKGDMSIIGPRPLLVSYLTLYNNEQKRRHLVRPGLSGWAQVNGRNAISWDKKFEYDVWYVDNISFYLDMKIFFLTIRKVFIKEGINKSKDFTMEPFSGSDPIS